MYAQQSLQDTLFLMLYGAVAILALVSGFYLPAFPLFRQAPIAILTNGAIKKRIIVFSPKI